MALRGGDGSGSGYRLFYAERHPSSLHLWIGPFGLHLFRRPFDVELDFCRDWRKAV